MVTYGNKNWGKEPEPGELNQMIEIVNPTTEADADGYAETHDKCVCKVWAKVVQSGDSTNPEANANAQASALNFAIRYREDVKPGMAVLFDGMRYEIVALDGFSFKKRFLGMKTVTSGVIGL